MEILLLLIPISFILVSIAIGTLIWAINHGQFEGLDETALELLEDDPLTHRGENNE